MFEASENEKNICRNVIAEITKNNEPDEKLLNEIIDITYSVGGGYNEETFRSITVEFLKIKKGNDI